MHYAKFNTSLVWLLAGFLLWATGCAQEEPPPPAEKIIRPVKVRTISTNASFMQAKVFSGVSEGIEEIALSFRVSGVLQTLPTEVGDKKKKGDKLATLDQRDFIFEVRNFESRTKDNKYIELSANIELPVEVDKDLLNFPHIAVLYPLQQVYRIISEHRITG